MVSGKRIVREILDRHPSRCREVLCSATSLQELPLPQHLPVFRLDATLFQRIDIVGTASPILICDAPEYPSASLSRPPDGLEVLCPFGDPNNLGTVMRSCAAFGVQRLILLKEAAHPFHPKAIRASSGMAFDQALYAGPAIAELLKPEISQWIVALDLNGENISTCECPEHIRLLVGEEGLGLPNGAFQQTLTIPQAPTLDSLNAATALSIALFTYRQRFPL